MTARLGGLSSFQKALSYFMAGKPGFPHGFRNSSRKTPRRDKFYSNFSRF
jgi:hypothetical protein